jgi:hypothetical protein
VFVPPAAVKVTTDENSPVAAVTLTSTERDSPAEKIAVLLSAYVTAMEFAVG